jgi:hypothetical protein
MAGQLCRSFHIASMTRKEHFPKARFEAPVLVEDKKEQRSNYLKHYLFLDMYSVIM